MNKEFEMKDEIEFEIKNETEFEFEIADLEDEKVKDFIERREEFLNNPNRGKSRGFGIDKTPLVYTQEGLEDRKEGKGSLRLTTDKDYIFHQDIEEEESLIKTLKEDKFLTFAEKEVIIQIIKKRLNSVKKLVEKTNNTEIIRKKRKMKKELESAKEETSSEVIKKLVF